MTDFHDVRFPLRLAIATSGGPARRTDIVQLNNGREQRNSRWANARRRYDAGTSVRTLDDLHTLLAFFESRRGQLHGFRFRDPIDFKSCAPSIAVAATDQQIGVGDGERARFSLVKHYGDAAASISRSISKPVQASVLAAIDEEPVPVDRYMVDAMTGDVVFSSGFEPVAGAAVSAGFEFDVPVHFDMDRLEINLTAFQAGQISSVPMVEIAP
jgi:uncharacterized protein (TIGR02217 family)